MIVVIPAYNENNIIRSLESLKACVLPKRPVEVIVLINQPQKVASEINEVNQTAFIRLKKWAETNNKPQLSFFPLWVKDLSPKHAGVGLARKIGLDEACYRLQQVRSDRGILVCFDADSLCETNYLAAIEQHFDAFPKIAACSIFYEHPIEGNAFEKDVYEGIIKYELHLRYYINMQRLIGFPFAYQTIGSSMAIRFKDYMAQGGMNKRKAGEDFYFLHKFIELGRFNELNKTAVIPSPRRSDRVPFGTGRAMMEILENDNDTYLTYHYQSFLLLAPAFAWMNQLDQRYGQMVFNLLAQVKTPVQTFFHMIGFEEKMKDLLENTSNVRAFRHRFYRWFNAFMLMKYLHYMRDHHYSNLDVQQAAAWFLKHTSHASIPHQSTKAMLLRFRDLDRKGALFSHANGVPLDY